MKNQNILRLSASAVMLSLLAACGGGGEEEGPENTIVKHEVIGNAFENQNTPINVLAGQSIPLSAVAETFGPKITSIVWAADAASADSKGNLNIADAQCASAALSSREVPGRVGFFVGTARCDTTAIASNEAGGAFTISSVVTATDGSQRVEKFSVNVVPKPPIIEPIIPKVTDFYLSAAAIDPVALNQIIRLNSVTRYDNDVAEKPNLDYSWSVVSSPENADGFEVGKIIGTEKEVGIVLKKVGKYIFALTAKMIVDDVNAITKTTYVNVVADEYSRVSPIGFKLNAKSEESTVFAGAPARLKAEFKVNQGTNFDSVVYSWSKVAGPNVQSIEADDGSFIVIPESEGNLLYAVEAEITSGAYKEKKIAFVSLRVESVSGN